MRRPEQPERRGARLALDEIGVGLLPGVLDGQRVDDLDPGRLAVDEEFDGRSGRRQFAVVGDILPEETEVVGGERLAVRPLVTGAQLQGELAVILGLVALKDVGLQLELVIVHDQPRIGVKRHQSGVACARHQDVDLAARVARAVGTGEMLHDRRRVGDALVDRRQAAHLDLLGKCRCLQQLYRRLGTGDRRCQETKSHPRGEIAPPHRVASCFLGSLQQPSDTMRATSRQHRVAGNKRTGRGDRKPIFDSRTRSAFRVVRNQWPTAKSTQRVPNGREALIQQLGEAIGYFTHPRLSLVRAANASKTRQ